MKNNSIIGFIVDVETRVIDWKARNGMNILRVCLGVVFIWFGALNFSMA